MLAASKKADADEAKAAKEAAVAAARKEAAEASAAKKAAAARAKAEKDAAAAAAEALAAQEAVVKKAAAQKTDAKDSTGMLVAFVGTSALFKIFGDGENSKEKDKKITELADLEAALRNVPTTRSTEFFILRSRMDAKRAQINEKGESKGAQEMILFGIVLVFAVKELALN